MFVKSNYMYVSESDATSFWLAIKFLSKRFRVSKAPASDSANGPFEFAGAFSFDTEIFFCVLRTLYLASRVSCSYPAISEILLHAVAQFFSKACNSSIVADSESDKM